MAQTPGKKLDPGLRQRLLNQRKAMSTGLIIKNSQFTKGIFRILPAKEGETPGVEYLALFGRKLNKGTTCPRTFSLKCPLMNWKDQISTTGSKEERDAAFKALSVETEYWMPVIPCGEDDDIGTAAHPNIKILRAKKKLYEQITARMVDEDIGEDICDLLEGRPVLIKKTGEKSATRWNADFLDRSPISDDPDYIEGVRAAIAAFDTRGRFYRVDWDRVAEIYKSLTGDDMDPSYREQEGADAGASESDDDHTSSEVPPPASTAAPAKLAPKTAAAAKPPPVAAAKPAAATVTKSTATTAKATVKSAAKPPPTPEPEPEQAAEPEQTEAAADEPAAEEGAAGEPDENGVIVGETEVTWNDGTDDIIALVVKKNDDDSYDVVVPAENYGGGEWTVRPGEFTVMEPANNDDTPEPEPAPEPKGPQRKPTVAAAETQAPAEVKRAAAKPPAAAATKPPPAPAAKAPVGPAQKSLRDRVRR